MKSKQSIRILIALMSLALTGVIVIQFLWIKNAVQLKQEQFDRSVNMAMIRVSADLENKYGVHLITEKLEKDSAARNAVINQDPGLYKFMIDINEDKSAGEESVVEYVGGDDEETSQMVNIRGPRPNHKVVAMINISGNEQQEVVIRKTVADEPVAVVGPTPPPGVPAPPCPPGTDCQLIDIVKNVADEYAMSKIDAKDICDVIDSAKIRTSIVKEFKKAGLPENFVFATYCTQGDTLMINKAASENPLLDFAYKSPLLATDFIEASSLLLVNFPSRMRYIFESIAGMLLLSLFFTIAIISAFAYSLHVIFKQKKVSDITNDFINNMTHELKTPLATISMTADTLALSNVSNQPERVNEYSGMIKCEVKKLSRHVDQILEAAVVERSNNVLHPERVNLSELVTEEVKAFEPLVTQRGGKIKSSLPVDVVWVDGMKDGLHGVISNLLDNALKYSKEVPDIKITVQKKGSYALLVVEDSGIGISRADQKRIFEKFFRASTGNRHDVKGFGLGLSFARNIVEKIGGQIRVESVLGQGSKFFVELPTI